MSKKKILEESTIRRFMKLASIDALTENYFDREEVYKEDDDDFPSFAKFFDTDKPSY